MDSRFGKELAQDASPEQAERDLQVRSDDAYRKGSAVRAPVCVRATIAPTVSLEVVDAADRDHDQSSSGALDR